jgi:hypothetical protein
MRQLILTLASCILFLASQAQAPEKMNYQGVARDMSGNVLANQSIALRITLHSGSPSGTTVYQERQTTTTNTFGLFAVELGGGTILSGTVAGINWGANSYYVQTELDASGGSSYTNMGTAQLLSVPYALYAKNAGGGGWALTGNAGTNPTTNFIGTTDAQPLRIRTYDIASGVIDYDTPYNTSFGYGTLKSNTTGGYNTALGYWGLYYNTTGTDNTALGQATLVYNTVGVSNTATGSAALYLNTAGSYNTAMGSGALSSNTTADDNTAVGDYALGDNTTGEYNTALGSGALKNNTIGWKSTAIGYQALTNAVSSDNTAIGYQAMYSSSQNGEMNTAIGAQTLYMNTSGDYNTATGYQSMNANETGYDNAALGYRSLYSNITGHSNVAVGAQSLQLNSSGRENVAVGKYAMNANTTGRENTATGYSALIVNTTGIGNVANGYTALEDNTGGNGNTAIGYKAIANNTTGNNNTGLGQNSITSNLTGSNNTALGYGADIADATTNATSLGYLTYNGTSNSVKIGNVSVTDVWFGTGNATLHANTTIASDKRFKYDVKPNVPGLEFINKLEPVTYYFDERKLAEFVTADYPEANKVFPETFKGEKQLRTGFLAQDVAKTAGELGYSFDGVHIPESEKDYYSISYSQFVVPLVKAVQQLSKQNEEMKKEIELLKSKVK